MDGRGRFLDNIFIERLWRSVKYEAVYPHELRNGAEAGRLIGTWIDFYNEMRPQHHHPESHPPRGSFSSVAQLKEKLVRFTDHYNTSGTQPLLVDRHRGLYLPEDPETMYLGGSSRTLRRFPHPLHSARRRGRTQRSHQECGTAAEPPPCPTIPRPKK